MRYLVTSPAGMFFSSAIWAAAVCSEAPAQPFPGGPPRETTIDVRSHGAKGDGKTKDTEAIQKAIEAAANRGGGAVCLGPGKYLSGTIFLKSNVTLYLGEGSTLLASTDPADYPRIHPSYRSYTEVYVCQSLIHAEKEHDIGITGSGAIDGQGSAFKGKPWLERPYLVRFVSCERARVEGIALRDSPMWVQHYMDCDHLTIRGITVLSHVNHNNDMIDIDGCRNVRVSDCFGDSGDDAITLKSTGARPCENVVITNCVVFSTCNAIKLGTESNGGFKNISISNCALGPLRSAEGFFGTKMLAGIALEIVDGGTLDRVAISNITMTGVRVPIFLRLGNRARPIHKEAEKPGMGTFQNVTISNVVAEAVERIGCSITGLPGHPIRNVSLSGVRLLFPGGGTAEEAARQVPEKPAAYPECTMFGVLPAYGLYCRHADGLTFKDVKVGCKERDLRPALVCEDVRSLEVDGFAAETAMTETVAQAAPLMILRNSRNSLIRGSIAPEGTRVFLRLEGTASGISVLANDLSRAAIPFEIAEGLEPAKALFQAANKVP
jgi:hypothetical protein